MARSSHARARIKEDLRSDFDWALKKTGMTETQFLEASIRAFVDYVRHHGGIWLPLQIEPKPPPDTVPKVQARPPTSGLAPGAKTDAGPSLGLNEPATEQSPIPARESSPPKMTRSRAALREMTAKERATKGGKQ
jgi:hypothetical protein